MKDLCAICSSLTYEKDEDIELYIKEKGLGLTFERIVNDVVFSGDNFVILAMRGSFSIKDWVYSDLLIIVNSIEFDPRYWRLIKIAKELLNGDKDVYFTGHSLGATICMKLTEQFSDNNKLIAGYSFNTGYSPTMVRDRLIKNMLCKLPFGCRKHKLFKQKWHGYSNYKDPISILSAFEGDIDFNNTGFLDAHLIDQHVGGSFSSPMITHMNHRQQQMMFSLMTKINAVETISELERFRNEIFRLQSYINFPEVLKNYIVTLFNERRDDLLRGGNVQQLSILDLVKKFAPIWYFHKNENFYPLVWEDLYPYFKVERMNDKVYMSMKETLTNPSGRQDFMYGSTKNIVTYVFIETRGNDIIVQYWHLYGYNRGKKVMNTVFGNHVGDIEKFVVFIDKRDMKPYKCIAKAHSHAREYDWNAVPKETGHPIVYSAQHSHGTYIMEGEIVYNSFPRLSDNTSRGLKLETWNNLLILDESNIKGNNSISVDGKNIMTPWGIPWTKIDYIGHPPIGKKIFGQRQNTGYVYTIAARSRENRL